VKREYCFINVDKLRLSEIED